MVLHVQGHFPSATVPASCTPRVVWSGRCECQAEVTQIRAGMVVMQALFEQRKRKFITQMEEDKAPLFLYTWIGPPFFFWLLKEDV